MAFGFVPTSITYGTIGPDGKLVPYSDARPTGTPAQQRAVEAASAAAARTAKGPDTHGQIAKDAAPNPYAGAMGPSGAFSATSAPARGSSPSGSGVTAPTGSGGIVALGASPDGTVAGDHTDSNAFNELMAEQFWPAERAEWAANAAAGTAHTDSQRRRRRLT